MDPSAPLLLASAGAVRLRVLAHQQRLSLVTRASLHRHDGGLGGEKAAGLRGAMAGSRKTERRAAAAAPPVPSAAPVLPTPDAARFSRELGDSVAISSRGMSLVSRPPGRGPEDADPRALLRRRINAVTRQVVGKWEGARSSDSSRGGRRSAQSDAAHVAAPGGMMLQRPPSLVQRAFAAQPPGSVQPQQQRRPSDAVQRAARREELLHRRVAAAYSELSSMRDHTVLHDAVLQLAAVDTTDLPLLPPPADSSSSTARPVEEAAAGGCESVADAADASALLLRLPTDGSGTGAAEPWSHSSRSISSGQGGGHGGGHGGGGTAGGGVRGAGRQVRLDNIHVGDSGALAVSL